MAIFYIKQNLVTKIVCYNMDFFTFSLLLRQLPKCLECTFFLSIFMGFGKNIALFAWPASMTDNSLPYFPKVAHY